MVDLQAPAKELLIRFYQRTKYKPEAIIFYRDGVADGQFQAVLDKELTELRAVSLILQRDLCFYIMSTKQEPTIAVLCISLYSLKCLLFRVTQSLATGFRHARSSSQAIGHLSHLLWFRKGITPGSSHKIPAMAIEMETYNLALLWIQGLWDLETLSSSLIPMQGFKERIKQLIIMC